MAKSFSEVAEQAIAEKIEKLEARNDFLEKENADLRGASPNFLINRLRLCGVHLLHSGNEGEHSLQLIEEEFGSKVMQDVRDKLFHLDDTRLSEDAAQQLKSMLADGPIYFSR